MRLLTIPFNYKAGKFKHNDDIDEFCSNCEDETIGLKCYHLSNGTIGLYLQLCEKCFNRLKKELKR